MASIRLHHPRYKSRDGVNITYAVELPWIQMPYNIRQCNACSQPETPLYHKFKTIHLRLDSNGDTFVAPGILELLRKVPGMAELEVMPSTGAPKQFVGALEQGPQQIILPDRNHYVPRVTKDDATVRMRRPWQPVVERIREKQDRQKTAALAEKRTIYIMGRPR